jgi:hypothetical protein
VVETTEETNDAQTWLRKGELLRWAFDLAFADPDNRRARYDEALALLDSDGALDRLTEYWSSDTASEFTDDNRGHFREHWLETPDTEAYLRAGFRDALEHARDRDVELNAIQFAAGAGDIRLARVDHPNSVTIVIWTPIRMMAPKLTDPRIPPEDPWVTMY